MIRLPWPFRKDDDSQTKVVALERTVKELQAVISTRWSSISSFYPYGGSEGEWQTGGWQRNLTDTARETPFRFSAVYACTSLIAGDISKLRFMLMEQRRNKTWEEVTDSPLTAVFRRPNHYQTWTQFVDDWITSKLRDGNAYILPEFDNRGGSEQGVIRAMFVLHPQCVTPLVSDSGAVFYRLGPDRLADISEEGVVVPGDEMIHDRMSCLWHPLIGVGPLFACLLSALQGLAIQRNAANFFGNSAMPGGILTAPGRISDETATRLVEKWTTKFTGQNAGKIAVLGDGLKFERLSMTAEEGQLAEQFNLMASDVARAFHVPPYKIGLPNTLGTSMAQLNQEYYDQALAKPMEAFEQLMDRAMGLPPGRRTEFDTDGLLRLDPASLAEANAKSLGSGEMAPNEARAKRNLPPVRGGDVPLMQQQMWPIDVLADRTPPAAPSTPVPAPNATPAADEMRALIERLQTKDCRL